MYILNLVLGCWLTETNENKKPSNSYLSKTPRNINKDNKSLQTLVKFWNSHGAQVWDCIHYPCIPEHFEVYKNLPDTWRSHDKTEVSSDG
jgi:hypothetical protein